MPNPLIKITKLAIFVFLIFMMISQNPGKTFAQRSWLPFGSPIQTTNVSIDDREAIAAQIDHAIKREITIEARVKKLLATDTEGLPHQKFLIELSNDSTILIAHDLKMAPAVPVKAGDIIRIHGEYIWNAKGGLIHWTHHSDTIRHESGWIDYNGSRYQ